MATLLKISASRFLIIALISLFGCKHSDKNSSLIFEELNESLERSNKTLERDISYAMMRLEDLTKKPETADKGVILLSNGQRIKSYTSQIVDFIDSINVELKKDVSTSKDLSSEGVILYKRLNNYRSEVLSVDNNVRREFSKSISITDSSFKKNFPNEEVFTNYFFAKKSTSFILASLSKFKNDLLNSEYQMLLYLRNNICIIEMVYDKFQAIASTNSSIFKRGQEMIIQTGVGAFNTLSNPSFKINGVDVPPNENGVGEYKMKIINEPGNYKTHVRISFIKTDGTKSVFEKDIEYTVIE